MSVQNKEVYIRNYIVAELAINCEILNRKRSHEWLKLADSLTKAAMDAYNQWQHDSCTGQFPVSNSDFYEGV